MKKTCFLIIPLTFLLLSCESDTPRPAVKLTVAGGHQRNVVVENKDIPVTFDILADQPVDGEVDILLSVNGETTAKVNEHFRVEKSTLQITGGNSKTYGKLVVLQENFRSGDQKQIRIDLKSSQAVFADTAYIICNITMGAIRSPRPEYCLPTASYGMYAGIGGFEFAGINNHVVQANPDRYFPGSAVVNYTAMVGEAIKENTYEYILSADWYKTGAGDLYEIVFFIDWNRDGDYGDEGEMILRRDMDKAAASKPLKGEIVVPGNAVAGLAGIRVGFFPKADSDVDNSGCGIIDSGEFEDYTLYIKNK